MKRKLILTNSIVVLFSLVLMLLISSLIMYDQNYKLHSTQAKAYLSLSASIFDGTNFDDTKQAINEIDSLVRLTIIDLDGHVIIDTQENEINENHLDRPELQNENLGTVFKRFSTTENKEMLYVAGLDENYYLRVSIPTGNINEILSTFILIGIFALLVILSISIFLIALFNKKTIEIINKNIKELSKIANAKYFNDEVTIDALPEILTMLTNNINDNINKIKEEQDKITTVLDLLNQAVIVIGEDENIKMMNKRGYDFFNTNNSIINKNYLYMIRDVKLQQIIEDCLKNKNNILYILSINEKKYQCVLSYVEETWLVGGVIITVADITKEYNLDKTKRDFFQNASHELKSPLTTIIGYQQMIVEGILEDKEQLLKYSSKTLKEAKRMNSIIMDMLNLSELEKGYEIKNEEIFLKQLILEIISSLEKRINDKEIKINLEIEDVKIIGDYKLVDELIRNIIDNAIKYNKQQGKIDIELKNKVLKISDAGVGIPLADQKRVFERFYRVDKGRSKEMGGTGLGLAIVKHICEIYHYNLKLSSIENSGTAITIEF